MPGSGTQQLYCSRSGKFVLASPSVQMSVNRWKSNSFEKYKFISKRIKKLQISQLKFSNPAAVNVQEDYMLQNVINENAFKVFN